MNGTAASLADEHEALIQFMYLAPVGLVQAGMDGEIVMINPVSAQLLMPLSRNGGLCNLFVALQDVAPELPGMCQAFAAPSGLICDGLHVHLHGGKQGGPQILSLSVLKLDSARLMAVLSDITVQVQRERQLRRSDAWLNALLTSSNDYALVSLDRAGRIERWHDSIGRVTGHTAALVGSSSEVLAPMPAVAERLREADTQGWSVEQGPRLRADGSSFHGSSIITPLPQGENEQEHEPAYCMVLRDLTGCTGAGTAATSGLLTDPLTGLANRRAFFEAAEAAARSPARQGGVAMILFDADHFTEVSARYGNAAGDAVLCALAQALRGAFRDADVIARLGGAQLGVLLAGIERDRAVAIAERLRAGVEQEVVEIDGHTLRYTVSVGVAAQPSQSSSAGIDLLMAQAGQALARARAGGGNVVSCREEADAG